MPSRSTDLRASVDMKYLVQIDPEKIVEARLPETCSEGGTKQKLLNVTEFCFPGKPVVPGQSVPGLCSLSWLMFCSVNFIHSLSLKIQVVF